MRSRVHVRRDLIARDRKTGETSAAVAVETTGMRKRYGVQVTLTGPSKVIYRPDKPLSCGARCWIETWSPVLVHQSVDSKQRT